MTDGAALLWVVAGCLLVWIALVSLIERIVVVL